MSKHVSMDEAIENCAAQEKTTASGVRERYWAELSIEEKIERCREQIKLQHNFFQSVHNLAENVRRLRNEFMEHRHQMDDGGKAVLPIKVRDDEGYGYGKNIANSAPVDPSKVYF